MPYLEAHGFTVKREGRHASVRNGSGDEVYRLTQTSGRWVWCDLYGQNGGDMIALVRDIAPGTSFRDAVFELTGGAALVQRVQTPKPAPESPPTSSIPLILPAFQPHQRSAGRAYLAGAASVRPRSMRPRLRGCCAMRLGRCCSSATTKPGNPAAPHSA
ncbi:MAG TPA: hypothetical protein PKE37_12490 [Thiomonas arsenitoxydans]|uniref:hypothetical protein n=1 Tax=Thiomonas arsenitoxydans (strain DSM 22701 / CIP 110005 / 3As) TaxID=426114 RepID=UPI002BDE2CA0|nr:hypothetical protein [Thiomonas arsenitoxydans]HML82573.1 hypothetical protein [Thiomonas arsenitoxydans]